MLIVLHFYLKLVTQSEMSIIQQLGTTSTKKAIMACLMKTDQ